MGTMSAPQVQYGRRKGLSRACSADMPSEDDPSGQSIPPVIDVRQMTVLPKLEWERIRNNLGTLDKEANRSCAERQEKEALHQRSKDIVKHWTNTIAGHRQKRLKAKEMREEHDEVEKRRLDVEEAEHHAEKRRQAIEYARTKLYYQTDKVKKFNGALQLSEAMREREAQIELNNRIAHSRKTQDDEIMKRKIEQEILKDQEKVRQQRVERKKNAEDLLLQIEEHKRELELLEAEDQKEYEQIKIITRLYQEELQKHKEMKLKMKAENMKNYKAYIEDRDILREIEKRKLEAEEEKIRLFVLAKKKMTKLKMDKEMEIQREVEKNRNNISAILVKHLQIKLDNEDERIANAVAALEEKTQRECREKEEKVTADLKKIEASRHAKMKQKEEEAKEEKLEALQVLYARKEDAQKFFADNKEKVKRAAVESKRVQEVQIQQMAERRMKSANEKKAEKQFQKQNDAMLTLEEEMFQEYAKNTINLVCESGGNPYPLIKAARSGFGGGHGPVFVERAGIRPSYLVKDSSGVELPSFQNRTTQEIKGIHDACDVNQSRKKLGFTW